MVAIRPLKSVWMDGRLVPWADAEIHVLTHGLHYGYAIFEGSGASPRTAGPRSSACASTWTAS